MTDYEAYEKWCRSPLTRKQIAKLHGVTDTEMQDIICMYGSAGGIGSPRKNVRAILEKQVELAKQAYERAGFKHPPRSTVEERMLAIDLRKKGFMYKAIARAFERRPDAIRAWVDDYDRRQRARGIK